MSRIERAIGAGLLMGLAVFSFGCGSTSGTVRPQAGAMRGFSQRPFTINRRELAKAVEKDPFPTASQAGIASVDTKAGDR